MSVSTRMPFTVMLNIKGDVIIEFNGIRVWNKL